MRKLAYVALRSLPPLLLFVIPGVNVVAHFVWMLLGAWMLAVTYLDYPMANHGIGFVELRARLAERRLLGLGFGGAAMAALTVPVLNFLGIPCSVAGATAMWVEQRDGDAGTERQASAEGGDGHGGRIALPVMNFCVIHARLFGRGVCVSSGNTCVVEQGDAHRRSRTCLRVRAMVRSENDAQPI